MAKSLRSKFKRKMRAIARVKKAPKEAARLNEAVKRRDQFDSTPQSGKFSFGLNIFKIITVQFSLGKL